jgi:hypothetical protein
MFMTRMFETLESRQLLTAIVLGGTGNLTVNATKTLADGSYVMAGFFNGQADFQPKGGTSFVSIANDGFIARYSVKNKLIWVKTIAGDGQQSVDAIALDPRNNDVVYAGEIGDTTLVPVGSGLQTLIPSGKQDMILGRLSIAGAGVRVNAIGGSDNNAIVVPSAIDVNANGDSVVSGSFKGSVDFSTNSDEFDVNAPTNHFAGFVAHYKPKNGLVWADGMINSGADNSVSDALWKDTTSVYFAGQINGKTTIDTFGTNYSIDAGAHASGLFGEFDGDGQKVFFDVLSGAGSVNAFNMLTYPDHILVAGNYSGTVDLNPGKGKFVLQQPVAGSAGSSLVGNYTTDGLLTGGMALGASSSLAGNALVALPKGTFGVVGQFRGNVDLDPSANEFLLHSEKKTVAGKKKLTDDVFFAEYDSKFSFLTGSQYGTTANDSVKAAAYNPATAQVLAAVLPNKFPPAIDPDIQIPVLVIK